MSDQVVTRMAGQCKMYLIGFDVIWGPAWSMSANDALRFGGMSSAYDAASDALAIMRPRAWCTPDYGSRLVVYVEDSA